MKLTTLILPLGCLSLTTHAVTPTSLADEHALLDQQRIALRAAATAFCSAVHQTPIQGLPTAERLQQLSPLITPELKSIIERARTVQQQMMRKRPDEKPPWIEGDLFSSSFEGVSGWEIESVFNAPHVDGTVKVRQHYNEPKQKPVVWSDTLVFKLRNDHWLLDNILMGSDRELEPGSSLRGSLPGGERESQDHESLDERWQVVFTRDGDKVTKVAIEPTDRTTKPQVLFGNDASQVCPEPTWLVWNQDCNLLALRLGTSTHFTRTMVYRLKDQQWQSLEIPGIHEQERKTMAANGFTERDTLIDADHWQDSNTLVVKFFTEFDNGNDGDGNHEFVSMRFDEKGKSTVVETVDVPGDN